MAITITAHYTTHVGQVRSNNEDSAHIAMGPKASPGLDALLVVADGMGGHAAGEFASSYAVENLAAGLANGAGAGAAADAAVVPALLEQRVREINGELLDLSEQRQELRGMGTTLTSAAITGDRLHIAHVGDSRAYLVRDRQIYQLTQDHSWVAEQVKAGALSPAEASRHPMRNVLTQALGGGADLNVFTVSRALRPGDALLLCSDGLTGKLTDEQILRVVLQGRPPKETSEELVRLANQAGGEDNITVLVAGIGDASPAPRSTQRRRIDTTATLTTGGGRPRRNALPLTRGQRKQPRQVDRLLALAFFVLLTLALAFAALVYFDAPFVGS